MTAATTSRSPSLVTAYRASNPPIEWATSTSRCPSTSRIDLICLASCTARNATLAVGCTRVVYTSHPSPLIAASMPFQLL